MWKKLRKDEKMTPEAKKRVYDRMDRISREFESDPKYKNINDLVSRLSKIADNSRVLRTIPCNLKEINFACARLTMHHFSIGGYTAEEEEQFFSYLRQELKLHKWLRKNMREAK